MSSERGMPSSSSTAVELGDHLIRDGELDGFERHYSEVELILERVELVG